jgi:hypothetical protein
MGVKFLSHPTISKTVIRPYISNNFRLVMYIPHYDNSALVSTENRLHCLIYLSVYIYIYIYIFFFFFLNVCNNFHRMEIPY